MHPAKRRRLDHVQVKLNKPFRSPLRTTKNTVDNHNSVITSNSGNTPTDSITNASNVLQSSPTKASNPIVTNTTEKGLTQKLKQTTQALDTAEQALQIITSGQDIQLEALITKWTHIARDAADELFIDAKARIEDMGGIEVWQRKAQTEGQLWAEANQYEYRTVEDVSSTQNGLSTTEQLSMAEECAVDQAFTMQVMLKQMNIDPALIGFDQTTERWVH
ncbi:hypothetical protein LTR84_003182 [Exophiala bonariae]|uniref:Uncharacterized protein n=1 Tax=Exophiala bonariae TaxID=1690606 RepID=A0AAV9NBP8_9EURO|nr:hypothetical protein LTR84_003182 [Exophiala bonariae]